MVGRVEGKVALVTGAAHGMGRSHALALAREGADVAAVDLCHGLATIPYPLGTEEELNSLVEEIETIGRQAMAIRCDVRKADEVERAVKKVVDRWGKVDILVNNAAVITIVPLIMMTEEQWDVVIDTNLKGTFLCCKYVLPHMIQQQSGKIINIGSTWGREGGAAGCHYSASKAGIHNFTHALAKEVAPYDINVNAIAPASVDTPMLGGIRSMVTNLSGLKDEEITSNIMNTQLFKRRISVEDVSNAVVFLASEESRNIQGSVIYVDAGHLAV